MAALDTATQPKTTPRAPLLLPAGWKLRRRGQERILQAELLTALDWVVHGFTLRPGGVSQQNGERVWNLAETDWDRPASVEHNRRRLLQCLQANSFCLVRLEQIHSALIRQVSEVPSKPLRGDGVMTNRSGLLLAVQTADCVPVLLADRRRRVVAAIHAGWRGLVARIVEKAVGDLRMLYDSAPTDLVVAIGPCIGVCCYEVGADVAHAFAAQFAQAAQWFEGSFDQLSQGYQPPPLQWWQQAPPGHELPMRARLNLPAATIAQLTAAGVPATQIVSCHLCTACQRDWLFSYRREGARAGRHLAVIGIRSAGGVRPRRKTTRRCA